MWLGTSQCITCGRNNHLASSCLLKIKILLWESDKKEEGTWLSVIEYCCIPCTLLDTRSREYMTRISVILIFHITLLKLWGIIYLVILHTNRLCQDSHLGLNTYCSFHYSVLSPHHIVSTSLENGFLLVWFIVHIIVKHFF